MKRLLIFLGIIVLLIGGLWAALSLLGEPTRDGKPISYWISQMGTVDSSHKLIGETTLDKMDSAKTIPYLVQTIGRKEQKESKWRRFYRDHYRQLPAIVRQRLSDPSATLPAQTEFIRSKAADYLGNLGAKKNIYAKAAMPKLIALLNNTNSNISICAARALEGFGKDAAPAVPAIISLLKTNPTQVYNPMFLILADSGSDGKTAIPILKETLTNSSAFLRINSASTLWSLDHGQANLVRPVVMEISTNSDGGNRIESATLLWRMDKDPKIVTPILISLLNDDTHPYDYRTLRMLKSMGPQASNAVPAVSAWLDRNGARKPAFVVKTADEALQIIGSTQTNRTSK